MRILITGSTGMVGKNLLEHPDIKKHDVLTPSSKELNLLDDKIVFDYLTSNKPNIIIHAAGKVGGIQVNMKNPTSFLIENINMGINLVMSAKKTNIKRFLNLGSSCMYPRDAQNPLNEELILKGELEPTNEGYAIAKVTIARLCEYISREDPTFYYKTLIPCNLYGKWDKFDPSHSHMIPAVIKKIHEAKINKQDSIEIWGDGKARREFLYAGDLADCILQSIQNFDSVPTYMNVGLGFDFTINEYYEIIGKVVGFTGEFTHDLSKPVGMKQKLVDISKLNQFGWKYKTNLEEGIKKTYEFYLENEKDQLSISQ
ncbi:MAG: GDP-L-fucose synthase [Candidatus Gastranaerophilales bacterium]|nr:GDP-L-fucose synthase [Candidatus Gastranaerophilales bacterium]